jgi:hypothetical protein
VEVTVFVRVARFEGANSAGIDAGLEGMRQALRNVEGIPEGLRSVKRVMSLVDRASGTSLDLTFCETEEDLRAADEALNQMSPPSDAGGRRTSVEMYEVGIDQLID